MPFPMLIILMLTSSLSFLNPLHTIEVIQNLMKTFSDPAFQEDTSMLLKQISQITPEQWMEFIKTVLLSSK